MAIVVDEEKCEGIGRCREVCPKGPRIWDIKEKCVLKDQSYCLACALCVQACPKGAIKLLL